MTPRLTKASVNSLNSGRENMDDKDKSQNCTDWYGYRHRHGWQHPWWCRGGRRSRDSTGRAGRRHRDRSTLRGCNWCSKEADYTEGEVQRQKRRAQRQEAIGKAKSCVEERPQSFQKARCQKDGKGGGQKARAETRTSIEATRDRQKGRTKVEIASRSPARASVPLCLKV